LNEPAVRRINSSEEQEEDDEDDEEEGGQTSVLGLSLAMDLAAVESIELLRCFFVGWSSLVLGLRFLMSSPPSPPPPI
jgi:hypothetical protein